MKWENKTKIHHLIEIAIVMIAGIVIGWEARGITQEEPVSVPQSNLASQNLEKGIVMGGNTIKALHINYYDLRELGTLGEAIIHCESRGDQSVIGKDGEIGVAQFMPETWEWMCELADYEGDINNEENQRWMLSWALENGYAEHWTCFNQLK